MKLKRLVVSIFLIMILLGIVGFTAWGTAGFKDKKFGRLNDVIEKNQKKEKESKKELEVVPNVLLKAKDLTKQIDPVLSGEMKQVMFRGANLDGAIKKVQVHVTAEPVNAQAEITARLLFKETKNTKNSMGEEINKYLTVKTLKNKGTAIFEIEKKLSFEEEAILEIKAGGLTYEIKIGCLPDECELNQEFVKAGRINVNADKNKPLFEFNLEKALKARGKSLGTYQEKFKSVIKYRVNVKFKIDKLILSRMQDYLRNNGYDDDVDKIFEYKGFYGNSYKSESIREKIMIKKIMSDFEVGDVALGRFDRGEVSAEIKEEFCNEKTLKLLLEMFQQGTVSDQEYKEYVRDFYNANGALRKMKKKNSLLQLEIYNLVMKMGEQEIFLRGDKNNLTFPEAGLDLVGIDNPVTKITGVQNIDV